MKRVPRSVAVAVATTTVLLVIAVAVFGLGDRATLVPAPEAVAEGLMKQLATHRYRQTTQFVSETSSVTLTPEALRGWFESVERRIGPVREVEGLRGYAGADTADAAVRLEGDKGSVTCEISLARQHGLWAVTDIRGC